METGTWTKTEIENSHLTVLKAVVEESTTPEAAATEVRTVVEAEAVEGEAGLNIPTENPDLALTCPLLEGLLLLETERRVRHAVRARTWR